MPEVIKAWIAGMPGPLRAGILVSLALHALALAVHWHDPPALSRLFEDTRMEVVLVNVPARERQSNARRLAQASVSGGGDASAARPTSPSPLAAPSQPAIHNEDAQQRIDTLQAQQQRLLSQVRTQIAQFPSALPGSDAREAQAIEEKRRQLLQLQAEIEQRLQAESAQPRRRYVGPDTREVVYAQYYDALRRRVELRGTRYFPEQNGRKLYGELVVMLTVNAQGELIATRILEGSGDASLDRQAIAIAQAAGPFGQFSQAMRLRFDEMAVVTRFRFARDEQVLTLGAAGDTR